VDKAAVLPSGSAATRTLGGLQARLCCASPRAAPCAHARAK
jgi:putative hemolysin